MTIEVSDISIITNSSTTTSSTSSENTTYINITTIVIALVVVVSLFVFGLLIASVYFCWRQYTTNLNKPYTNTNGDDNNNDKLENNDNAQYDLVLKEEEDLENQNLDDHIELTTSKC